MKRIIFSIFLAAAFLPLSVFSQARVKGTIADKGSNKIGVYGQSSLTLTNVLFRNILITLSIADQGAGNPTDAQIILASGIPNLDLVPTVAGANPYIVSGRAYYSYNMSDNGLTTTNTWPAGRKDNLIADFTFPTNSFFPTLRLDDLSSAGGPNGQMYWYVEVIGAGDITDYSSMFFGDIALPPTNNGGVSPSFVPLQNISVIPVKFTSFTATRSGNDGILKWNVMNEDANTDRYELERSFNGSDFSVFNTMPRTSNASSNTYTSTDGSVASRIPSSNSTVYYRIRQVDKDGKFAYTEIRNIRFGNKAFGASVFPNPVKDHATITVDLDNALPVRILITDATGKEMQNLAFDGVLGGNTKNVNMNSFAAGTYLFKITAGNNSKVVSVIKSK